MRTWLDTIAPQSASESTIDSVYRPRVENWINPHIGGHRLDRLEPEHLDALYVAMAEAGLQPKTIVMAHQMIGRALKMAVRRRYISVNVATLLDSPSHRPVEIEPLSREEARALLAAAADLPNAARWSVAFSLGLRQCETLGLRWRYVDLDQAHVRIWQLTRRRFRHGCTDPHGCGSRYHTKNCRRDCTNHGRYCPQRRGGDWTFRSPKGGMTRTVPIPPPLVPEFRAHKALLTTAGIRDARPHDARHTAATLLLEQGVDISVVQEILGHASLAVTKRYTPVTSRTAEDAAVRIGEALWPGSRNRN